MSNSDADGAVGRSRQRFNWGGTILLMSLPFAVVLAYHAVKFYDSTLLQNVELLRWLAAGVASATLIAVRQSILSPISEVEAEQERLEKTLQDLRGKTIDDAAAKAEKVVGELKVETSEKIRQEIASIKDRVDKIVEGNPWLKTVDPDYVALWSKSYEPIVQWAMSLLKRGDYNALYQWLYSLAEEGDKGAAKSSLSGTKESLIDLWELATFTLRDHRLALRFVDQHLSKTGTMDLDLLALKLYSCHRLGQVRDTLHVTAHINEIYLPKLTWSQRWKQAFGFEIEMPVPPRSLWFVPAYRAQVSAANGQYDRAKLLFSDAKALHKTRYERSQLTLGEARMAYIEGDVDAAAKSAEESLTIDPSNAEAYEFLYRVQIENNDAMSAAGTLEKGIALSNAARTRWFGIIREMKALKGEPTFMDRDKDIVSTNLSKAGSSNGARNRQKCQIRFRISHRRSADDLPSDVIAETAEFRGVQ